MNFIDLELDGIDHSDYPKFCDAFICYANVELPDGTIREATEDELDKLNDDPDLVYQAVMDWLY